jgi:hypothetical protein
MSEYKPQNQLLCKLGTDAGLLNYIDHETPREYFMSSWATEEDVFTFAEMVIEECFKIMKQTEEMPVGFIQPKSAETHYNMLKYHFGLCKGKK